VVPVAIVVTVAEIPVEIVVAIPVEVVRTSKTDGLILYNNNDMRLKLVGYEWPTSFAVDVRFINK